MPKTDPRPEPHQTVGSKTQTILISLGLFLLALLPRAYDLPRFVTADEAKWVYRSAQFLAALIQGDFAGTSVNLTPAVTTTWLGSLGLTIYYYLNQATLDQPFTDWLLSLPEFRAELDVLVATRWPMVVVTALVVVGLYWLTRWLFGPGVALIAAIFIALDPHTISLSRILGHDAPAAMFMGLSLLLFLLAIKQTKTQKRKETETELTQLLDQTPSQPPPQRGRRQISPRIGGLKWGLCQSGETKSPLRLRDSAPLLYALSGIAAGLAVLSKAPALFLIPFAGLLVIAQVWANGRQFYAWVKRFLLWSLAAYLTFIILWPAAWVDPLGQPAAVVENAFLSATDDEEADAEGYWLVPDLGPFYYLVNGGFKLSPLVMVGAGLAIFFVIQQQRMGTRANGDSQSPNLPNALKSPPPNPPEGGETPNIPPAGGPGRAKPSQFPNLLSPNLPTLRLRSGQVSQSPPLLSLLLFTLLFTLFMTLGEKRSPRYILPIFPALAIIAGWGWLALYRWATTRQRPPNETATPTRNTFYVLRFAFYATLLIAALTILIPHIPYYFTYYNPLLGGAYTAPGLVKIGWGEGLDQVGRFLERELPDSRVGTAYASTVAPFFRGDLSAVDGRHLDYVVLYRKQVQSGNPAPSYIRYYASQSEPLFSVNLNGIHYADVYPGPAVQPALTLTPDLDTAILPKPTGFRPLTAYGHIGEALEIDVIWLVGPTLPPSPSTMTLEPLSVFDFSHEGHDHADLEEEAANLPPAEAEESPIFAQGQGALQGRAEGLVISHHRLDIPADLPRGLYALRVDGRPLGEIELRNFQVPPDFADVEATFAEQISIRAYQFDPTEDYMGITIAWQAEKDYLPDYTVFAQMLEAETNERLAGVDTRPLNGDWPTSRWVEGEVVVDRYLIATPPGLQPGFFKLIVGLYRPETGERLILENGQDHWVVPWTVERKQ